jgi:signal peptide peptidase SppA
MKLYRFLDTPIALRDVVAAEMLQNLRERVMRGELEDREENARSMGDTVSSGRDYDVVQNVAIIPVNGVLVNGVADPWSDETSYSTIQDQVVSALTDPDVKGVAMLVGSPGGEVSGLFDFAETLAGMKGDKPIWSILDDHAYSAAYAIAASTDHITVPKTGGVGSIGVITMHLDVSKMLDDMGLKVSIIQYGEQKSDYSMFKPLSDAAKSRLQGHIDSVGEMFVELVGRNRSMSKARVRATEAGLYMGSEGVEAGLADAVMSPAEAFSTLAKRVKRN